MEAIEDAFDDQEYEMDLDRVMVDYKLSTQVVKNHQQEQMITEIPPIPIFEDEISDN